MKTAVRFTTTPKHVPRLVSPELQIVCVWIRASNGITRQYALKANGDMLTRRCTVRSKLQDTSWEFYRTYKASPLLTTIDDLSGAFYRKGFALSYCTPRKLLTQKALDTVYYVQ